MDFCFLGRPLFLFPTGAVTGSDNDDEPIRSGFIIMKQSNLLKSSKKLLLIMLIRILLLVLDQRILLLVEKLKTKLQEDGVTGNVHELF